MNSLEFFLKICLLVLQQSLDCSPGYPRTPCIAQVHLKLMVSSVSQVLVLQA